MSRIFSLFKENFPFILIFFIALFLRVYRLPFLTNFGGDQGQDFVTVYDMVVQHKWTLLGIKTSSYDFFQGPIYLYMLLPFFVLFKLQPMAGAWASVFYSLVTLVLLYITVSKFFSKKIAVFSTLLFAVSPEFIFYGTTPLYQHFLPPFIIASLYLFLIKKRGILVSLTLGFFLGIGVETHLLNITLVISIFIFFLFFERKWKSIFFTFLGILAGFSPTILFELRHNFLNIRYLLNYHPATTFNLNFSRIAEAWGHGSGTFLAGNSWFLGIVIVVAILVLPKIKRVKNDSFTRLYRLSIILVSTLIVLSISFSAFAYFYILPLWVVFLILLPVVLDGTMPKKYSVPILSVLVLINLVVSIGRLSSNHGYTMPDGWNLVKARKVADIISGDVKTHPNFNVANILDSETRAFAIRYLLLITNTGVESIKNYNTSNYLYVVSRGNDYIEKTSAWEISSFKPYTVGQGWNLGDGIYLQRLDRNSWLEISKTKQM